MYDVALKPRLLDTLIRDHLPHKDHPFSNPSELSKVVSLIKTHSLLSESVTESMEPKIAKAWKSAVTSWVHRILSLTPLSNTMPDKCWAGISLLGVTCEECNSERFLESYSVWFQELLTCLQLPTDSHLVRVVACASMSDLLARLSGFPEIKKDGSSCALKAVQPVLRMLHDDNSEAIWVSTKEIPAPKNSGLPLNAYLLHSLAHVELNAIDLAWDTVVLGEGFFADFAHVADDESLHISWCSQRLAELGFKYRDMPAHNLLWRECEKSSDNVAARLAGIPLVQVRVLSREEVRVLKEVVHHEPTSVAADY